jgi:heme-degrading monooxygenase HmoA
MRGAASLRDDGRPDPWQREAVEMMTVITHVTLHEGAEPEWDGAMEERLAGARARDGWVRGELLMPLEAMNKRVIVGTWRSRADWEAWHQDPAFTATAARLDALQAQMSDPQWHEVIADVTSHRPLRSIQAAAGKSWETTTRLIRRITKRG